MDEIITIIEKATFSTPVLVHWGSMFKVMKLGFNLQLISRLDLGPLYNGFEINSNKMHCVF